MESHLSNDLRSIEWSVASRALPGENVSGDLHLVRSRRDGVLVAVVDGLGHGSEATDAAKKAIEAISMHADDSIISIVQRCHAELKMTRGAAMTLALFNTADSTVTVLGIGNVEAVLLRANRAAANPPAEPILLRGGVVGYQLPALHASVFPLYPGDMMVFATDGVRNGFADKVNFAEAPKRQVERMLEQNFRGVDDALVLAVRYLGVS